MRLQKYMDKLTGISQKGYSNSKQCQEVLINIVNSVSYLRERKIRGALISLDIKKAFDSTSHTVGAESLSRAESISRYTFTMNLRHLEL
jgi:hypothetical protein